MNPLIDKAVPDRRRALTLLHEIEKAIREGATAPSFNVPQFLNKMGDRYGLPLNATGSHEALKALTMLYKWITPPSMIFGLYRAVDQVIVGEWHTTNKHKAIVAILASHYARLGVTEADRTEDFLSYLKRMRSELYALGVRFYGTSKETTSESVQRTREIMDEIASLKNTTANVPEEPSIRKAIEFLKVELAEKQREADRLDVMASDIEKAISALTTLEKHTSQ